MTIWGLILHFNDFSSCDCPCILEHSFTLPGACSSRHQWRDSQESAGAACARGRVAVLLGVPGSLFGAKKPIMLVPFLGLAELGFCEPVESEAAR